MKAPLDAYLDDESISARMLRAQMREKDRINAEDKLVVSGLIDDMESGNYATDRKAVVRQLKTATRILQKYRKIYG